MKRAIGKARMFKLICLLEDGIGIVGSPRKNGNVDTLVSRVLEGAREAGLDTSKYLLNDFALALKMLGFEVVDIIRMVDGITPDAVLAKGELLDMARSAGAALGGR